MTHRLDAEDWFGHRARQRGGGRRLRSFRIEHLIDQSDGRRLDADPGIGRPDDLAIALGGRRVEGVVDRRGGRP